MLLASLFLFVGVALVAWSVLRSGPSTRETICEGRSTHQILLLAADAIGPVVERSVPRSVLASFEDGVLANERASRLGARRVVAIVCLLGVALAVLFIWLALLVGSVRIAIWAVAIPPLTLAIAQMHFRRAQLARQRAIRREFPYALDLLVLLCRAGAPPAIAFAKVALDCRNSAWGRELQRAIRETELGATRAKALTEIADRTRMPEVTSFVAAVRQAEELGRPLGDVLEQFADRIREQRVQAAEAAAGAASVKIMAPAIIVFMVSVILLLVPFVLKVVRDGLPF